MRKASLVVLLLLSFSFGFVRIERVKKSLPFTGPKAEGREGDFVLCNERVAFIVEARSPSSGYNIYPGGVLDAGYNQGKNHCKGTSDYMGEVFMALMPNSNLTLVRGISFSHFQASRQEGKVILEAKGKDVGIPIIEEFLNTKTSPLGVKIERQYILEEGKSYLTIRTTFVNEREKPFKLAPGYAFLLGDGLKTYVEEVGFDMDRLTAPKRFRPYIAALGDSIAYAWYARDSRFKVDLVYGGVFFGFYRGRVLKPGKKFSLEVRLYVLPPSVEKVRQALSLAGKVSLAGTVKEKSGKPLSGARVHLTQGKKHITMDRTDADGKYEMKVDGGKYKVTVVAFDHPILEKDIEVQEETTQDFVLEPSAQLSIVVKDDEGVAIPAMLTAQGKTKELAAIFGEDRDMSFPLVQFLMPGESKINITPGTYTLTLSRGFEYEIAQQKITLSPGQVLEWQATLKHSVDTSGYLSGDFHVHAMPSPDSNDYLEDKVRGLAAHGLELPVATDHNKITDYMPVIKKLGLTKFLRSVIGDELTTIQYGHFNTFPLPFRPDLPDNGAPQWWGRTPPEIFRNVRKLGKDIVIQVNHPRSGSMGYFSVVELDPETSVPEAKAIYSDDFDAVEIFNGKRVSQLKQTFPDWFGFLNHGVKLSATGNSDSHHIFRIEAGYPRNYIYLKSDRPDKVSDKQIVEAIKKQKVVVSGGPFIHFSINGKGLGELAKADNGRALISIKVQSPTWMPLTKVSIVQNGKTIKEIPIQNNESVVKFDDRIELEVDKDSWFIVIAEGEKDLSPVYPGARPYSFTNPIYVDANGNGKFEPPAQGEKSKT